MTILLRNAMLVGLGGFLGSVMRYMMAQIVLIAIGQHWYPLGTLVVNVLGSQSGKRLLRAPDVIRTGVFLIISIRFSNL